MAIQEASLRDKRWWSATLSGFVGLAVSIYLSWIKLADKTAACGNIGDCESVNSSRFAEVGNVPIALLGAGAYLVILLLLYLEDHMPERMEILRFGVLGISFAGTLYSAYLTYIELAVLKAVCPYCVISAVAITAIFVLSILRLRDIDPESV